MDHFVQTLRVHQSLLLGSSKRYYIDTRLGKSYVVLCSSRKEPADLAFPKLEALMLLQGRSLLGVAREVLHHDIVSVNVDCLVSNY